MRWREVARAHAAEAAARARGRDRRRRHARAGRRAGRPVERGVGRAATAPASAEQRRCDRHAAECEALADGPLRLCLERIHAGDATLTALRAGRELKFAGCLGAYGQRGLRLLCTSLELARHAHRVSRLELPNHRLGPAGARELARCLRAGVNLEHIDLRSNALRRPA